MEVRVSYPHTSDCFNILQHSTFQLLSSTPPSSIKERQKTDEYLLLSDRQLNLKLGDGGRSYDLKLVKGEARMLPPAELWVNCAKGKLSNPGDVNELTACLRKDLGAAEPGSGAAEGLQRCIDLLSVEGGPQITHVITEKHLSTAAPVNGMTVEQIDFVAFRKDAPDEKYAYRSFSVEKELPAEALQRVWAAAWEQHGADIVVGGFPGLLHEVLERKAGRV